MNNKRKLIISIIIILLILSLCIVLYENRANIPVFSAITETTNDIPEGMDVIMLGGSTMKDKGNMNSMRIYY